MRARADIDVWSKLNRLKQIRNRGFIGDAYPKNIRGRPVSRYVKEI